MDFGQFAAFTQNAIAVGRDDFCGDGAVHDGEDFIEQGAEGFAGFGDEAGVGCHAVNEAEGVGFADFVDFAGVYEDFH